MRGLTQRLVGAGPVGLPRAALRFVLRHFYALGAMHAPTYLAPTAAELVTIEAELAALGIDCADFVAEPEEFRKFSEEIGFSGSYHGGADGGVYEEKLLEHFVAWQLLGLEKPGRTPYVDVAACSSPWARLLRARGVESFAIDLDIGMEHRDIEYYRKEDATRTTFASESIASASLQCAYEMFAGNDDVELLRELTRILKPGGRAVVSPLYMHTHPCHYQTAEYFGRVVGDPGAKAYVRRDCWGVPTSRKYSPMTFKDRVWETALQYGLVPRLLVLRNKTDFSAGVYLHYILVLDKPDNHSALTAPP